MKKQSCTVGARAKGEGVGPQRPLPLVDVLVDARTRLLELVIRAGLKVVDAMLEGDRVAIAARGMSTTAIGSTRARAQRRVRSCWAAGRWRFGVHGCAG